MIPHKETTELINLSREENKKEEAKMGTTKIGLNGITDKVQ